MYKILRRGTGRILILGVVVVSLLLCLYYVSQTQSPNPANSPSNQLTESAYHRQFTVSSVPKEFLDQNEIESSKISQDTCPLVKPRDADIDTLTEFTKFDFQVSFQKQTLNYI